MTPPLFVRPLAELERTALSQGLRCPDALSLCRWQTMLLSDRGRRPALIAAALGCGVPTVRDALHAFPGEVWACLHVQPKTPTTIQAIWPQDCDPDLRAGLHPSPRTFG